MRARRGVVGGLILVIVAAVIMPGARGKVKSASAGKFKVEQEVIVGGSPVDVYDAVTGDISAWWDHTISGHPKQLFVEAKPGGGFWEIFNDDGDGMKNATVIYAERGKMLRFEGPLWSWGTAVTMVTTYALSADPLGTKFHLTFAAAGDVDESDAKIVGQIWHHLLVERLKPYVAMWENKRIPTGASSREDAGGSISQLAFLAGRWTGTAGTAVTEEICTAPMLGEMSCMFRAIDAGKIEGLEFITLREVPATAGRSATAGTSGTADGAATAGSRAGIEERVRFFGPDLSEKEGDNGITLRLASASPTEFVFDNVKTNGFVKHMTIARQDDDHFSTHIEIVDAAGKTGSIDAKWKREK